MKKMDARKYGQKQRSLISSVERKQRSHALFLKLEPVSQNMADLEDIDFMIVPLSSYDSSFHRCGYGKGYYDSILGECRYKVGIAFHEQYVDGIEVEPFDVSLDYVISC